MNQSRVITKIQKSSLDLAIVVPCYNEGVGVIDTLYSVAIQKNRDLMNLGVFLVINNSVDVPESILESNKKTAQLVINLLRKNVDTDLFKYQQKKIHKILDAQISVGLIDCYSEKYAPQNCNVGYARDVGTRSILKYLHSDDSVIVHTDADCTLDQGYIEGIYGSFRKTFLNIPKQTNTPVCDIATGFMSYVPPHGKIANEVYERYRSVSDMEFIMKLFLNEYNKIPLYDDKYSDVPATVGANMIFRKSLFEDIGGIEHIGGGEDVKMGIKARKKGYETHRIDANISTKSRISDRTIQGHGYGFEVQRKGGTKDIMDVPSMELNYHNALIKGEDILVQAHLMFSGDRKKWNTYVFRSFASLIPMIDERDILILENIYFEYIGGLNNDTNSNLVGIMPTIISEMRIVLRKYFESQTLYDTFMQVKNLTDDYIEGLDIYNSIGVKIGNIDAICYIQEDIYMRFLSTKIALCLHMKHLDDLVRKLKHKFKFVLQMDIDDTSIVALKEFLNDFIPLYATKICINFNVAVSRSYEYNIIVDNSEQLMETVLSYDEEYIKGAEDFLQRSFKDDAFYIQYPFFLINELHFDINEVG